MLMQQTEMRTSPIRVAEILCVVLGIVAVAFLPKRKVVKEN